MLAKEVSDNKKIKNTIKCDYFPYVNQVITQQRLNVLLQLQFYNIFTNFLFMIYELPKIYNKVRKYCQTLALAIIIYQTNCQLPYPNCIQILNYILVNFILNIPQGTKDSFGTKLKKRFRQDFFKKCSAKSVLFCFI